MGTVTQPGPNTFPGPGLFPGYTFTGTTMEARLLEGIALTLAEGNPHGLTWHGDGSPYTAGQVGIYREIIGSGEHGLALTVYTLDGREDTVGVQFHIRSTDPAVLAAIVQHVFDLFEGRWGGMLGTIRLVLSTRLSGTAIGQDANGRRGRYENYSLTVARETPQRP